MKERVKDGEYVIPEKYMSYADRIPSSYIDKLVQLKLVKHEHLASRSNRS